MMKYLPFLLLALTAQAFEFTGKVVGVSDGDTLTVLYESKKQYKVDKTDYQDVADCIRSDQVPAPAIVEYFSDKTFYKWYSDKYFV